MSALRSVPPVLDVPAIVAMLAVEEVKPWSQVLPSYGCLFDGGTVVWAGPLEEIGEQAYASRGLRLALHPDDIAKLHALSGAA